MPVSETRLAIRLDDRATAGLQSLTGVYSRFSSTVQNSGRQMGGFASNADKAASSLSNMNQMMERLVYSASRYFVIYKALGAVGNVWDTLVGGSYEYAKSLETNQIGIAGILKSMVTLNGEQIKWNDAMALSGKAMKGLQSEALRTAATSKELIETFRALLGPGLSSGMSIDQIVQLSTVGTNAVRSLGLPTNQYVQELRSIITEGIRPASSTLATSLGITNKDIKEAKASAEGLFNFLMKRMQGFSDAVKYTSGTVEGRIARIQEGLQVAGEKGAKALYKQYSAALEKIADYLIPVPKKLGDQWQINPEFVKGVEKVSTRIAKIAKDITEIGVSAAPLASVFGGGALTAIGQFADKLKYIAGFMLAKKVAPFLSDVYNIAVHSREAAEAQTGLGRALQAVSDVLWGRAAALQRVTAMQEIYNGAISNFFGELNYLRNIDNLVKTNSNSVLNLAETWQKMGMSAEHATERQNAILKELEAGNMRVVAEYIAGGNRMASAAQERIKNETAVNNVFNQQLAKIKEVRNAILQTDRSKKSVNDFIYGGSATAEQAASAKQLLSYMEQIGIEEQKMYQFAVQYTNELKKGNTIAAEGIRNQITESAQLYVQQKAFLEAKKNEVTLSRSTALEASALGNAYSVGGEKAYQALNRIIAQEKELVAEMKKRGMSTTEVEERHVGLLNAVTSATKNETAALIKNADEKIRNERAQVGLNNAYRIGVERAMTFLSKIGGLFMGFGFLCDVLEQADEKNKEWYESAGDAAMTGGMVAMAIGQISGAISGMIPMLAKGIEWLNKFSIAKGAAGLGSLAVAGGAVVAGVGAIVYHKYKEFQEKKVASQIDPWTGEEISYKYVDPDVDDADRYPIINDHSYNYRTTANTGTIGLQDFGHAGAQLPADRSGSAAAAKANKAEEYAAKMLKIYEDLNKEIANMSGQTTAYDKVMAQAKDKLAGYEKDIVKAQQLGVDVGKVRNKQIEYRLAMEKKAREAQQDEHLKYMKQDEEAANRINIMGGTMEQQRAALAERLEIHKAYLEKLLAANIKNRDRKMQLEQELANVQKQINDNSVYDFKSGWTQALDEIANRQVNFKEQVVNVFDSINGSLVTLVSSTGSAKDKFKQFCQDVTNTILKSMTQIIIQGLITKAILGAIGFSGGSKVTQTATGWVQEFRNGVKVSNMPTNIRTHASGGFASGGEWAMVGEQGPELVRFGSAGRVYNNNETKSMLGGGNPQNIKIELKNESGTQLKADEASVSFDADTMIISTVIKGVGNNTLGIRNMLKGAATT